MKKPITLVLALLTFASVAQYNNTYDVNANSDNLTPAFVITNKKAESITVSYASSAFTIPQTDYFILTKHDAFGNVLYNNRIDPYFGPTDGLTNVEALIQTDDDGVLVAGYYYEDANHIEQPFLVKVDVNGNFLWSRIYFVNQKPFKSALNKVSLCRVFNDPKENYFIVAGSDSDVNPGADVATNVIKVDANGAMLFSKKYYDVGTSPSMLSTYDYPGDIDFSPVDKIFMITGFRQHQASLATKTQRSMFYFGIDNNGVVMTKYLTLTSKSIPLDQDMVYDPNTNVFATTFTHEKNAYVAGPSSIIGFVTIDASLNVANPKYYWHKYGASHNGRSISLCKSGEYLICSGTLDNNSTFVNNPAWLKVDPSGNPVSGFLRYNIKDDVYFGHHATTYNPDSGDEEYVLVNQHKTDLRVIRTTSTGKACGVEKFEPYVDKYDPKITTYKYDYKDNGDYKRYKVYEKLFTPDYRKCDGDGSSYRPTGIAEAGSASGSVLVYPTVVSAGNAYITVENTSGAEMNLQVYNMSGQLVFSDAKLATGKTEVKLHADLSAGIYLVKTFNTYGKLTSTSKILITE